MNDDAVLRGVTGPPGSRLKRLLGEALSPIAPLRGAAGCFQHVVAKVERAGEDASGAEIGIPDGAAAPEALAVSLRLSGAELRWAEPIVIPNLRSLLRLCRDRGRSSVELARTEPSLVPGLQIGCWFDAPWRTRLSRRICGRLGRRAVFGLALTSRRWLLAAADLAFWAGVRQSATPQEWRLLTASSYVALLYHRFAGELKPGQERLDIAPGRFAHQLWALRIAGFRPLSAAEIVAFHAGDIPCLGPRAVAISVDDAVADCVEPLTRHANWAPQLFVPTAELGGSATWLDGEPVAGWDEVRSLAAKGVAVGSHGRHHRRLTQLDSAARSDELEGSLADLHERLEAPWEVFAFPNGDHDIETCWETRDAGFKAAFTTAKGRNGVGTDPYCLKRVSVHGDDGVPAVLWKALTGEALPPVWVRLRRLARLGQRAS